MRSCSIVLAAALCAVLLPAPRARAAEPPPGFEALAARLATQHPEYLAAEGEVDAARAAVDAAAALPDPMLEVELMDLDSDRPGMDRSTRYTWEQLFPLWGKRGLRREAAGQAQQAVEARRELRLAGLRAELRMAYAELYAAHRASAINAEVAGLLTDMAAGARTRYANGLAAQQDLIRVRTEQTQLAAEDINLRGEIRRASVRINSLLGDPPGQELAAPAALPDTEPFERAWSALQRSVQAAPALAEADAVVRQSRAARELAARERYPDVALGVAPVEMDGRLDSWQLKLKVEIPLWGGRAAAEAERVAMLTVAEHRLDAARRGVQAAADDAWAAYQSASERQRLFATRLQDEASLNLRAAVAGYQGGEVDFDTVIEAERQLRDTRLQALAAAVERQRAVARFEQITGVQP